ncbi:MULTISPECIES: DUF6906 family protein [Paenibacillus]|uniref:DUF6906 family protein n=1 Tax=Paenibacillus TaxID=44249 RepID=UPI001BCADD09|nr:hypothetical protein [Paenibacillus dendritiformis]
MQQPKRPTRKQKIEISQHHLNPNNWFVERDIPWELVLIQRKSGKIRRIRRM